MKYHNGGLGCHGDSVVGEKWLDSGYIWEAATDLLIFWVRVAKGIDKSKMILKVWALAMK